MGPKGPGFFQTHFQNFFKFFQGAGAFFKFLFPFLLTFFFPHKNFFSPFSRNNFFFKFLVFPPRNFPHNKGGFQPYWGGPQGVRNFAIYRGVLPGHHFFQLGFSHTKGFGQSQKGVRKFFPQRRFFKVFGPQKSFGHNKHYHKGAQIGVAPNPRVSKGVGAPTKFLGGFPSPFSWGGYRWGTLSSSHGECCGVHQGVFPAFITKGVPHFPRGGFLHPGGGGRPPACGVSVVRATHCGGGCPTIFLFVSF